MQDDVKSVRLACHPTTAPSPYPEIGFSYQKILLLSEQKKGVGILELHEKMSFANLLVLRTKYKLY